MTNNCNVTLKSLAYGQAITTNQERWILSCAWPIDHNLCTLGHKSTLPTNIFVTTLVTDKIFQNNLKNTRQSKIEPKLENHFPMILNQYLPNARFHFRNLSHYWHSALHSTTLSFLKTFLVLSYFQKHIEPINTVNHWTLTIYIVMSIS